MRRLRAETAILRTRAGLGVDDGAEVDLVALEIFADAVGPGQQIQNVGGRFEIEQPQRLVAGDLSAAQNPFAERGNVCRDFLRQPIVAIMVDSIPRGKFFASGHAFDAGACGRICRRGLRGDRHVQINGQRGDLHVVERAAFGGGEGGHERAGLAVGDPGAPEIVIGRHFQVVQIRHHCGAVFASWQMAQTAS